MLLHPPSGLDLGGDSLLLERNLYGLPSAARVWNLLLQRLLVRYGLVSSAYDKSLWYHPKKPIYACVHVDDILVVGPPGTAPALANFLRRSPEKIECTVSELSAHLGREYTAQPDGTLLVTVKSKIEELVASYPSKRFSTPTPSTDDWMAPPSAEDIQEARGLPFREVIGSLLWIARARIDIRFAATRLARFASGWGKLQFAVALRVVGYLDHTKHKGFVISPAPPGPPTLLTDASWGDDPYTRQSVLGFVVQLGDTIVDFGSVIDKSIATASAESEYRAASLGVREVKYFRYQVRF
jgi:hypothetical protein